MAKVIGRIKRKELKARLTQSRRLRYNKALKVHLGPLLREALKTGYARSS